MQQPDRKPLLLCYISGLDLRRIHPDTTPFLAELLEAYPWAPFTNIPSNELFPTIVTGVDPTEHGIWGVKLKSYKDPSIAATLVDRLPDGLTTTAQGFLHLLTNTFDLAAIPPRRRRRFEITRTKYKRRMSRPEALSRIGVPSLFSVLGEGCSRYVFTSTRNPDGHVLQRLCTGRHLLEVLELYSLDRYQQWNLDREGDVCKFYGRIDDFLRHLHLKCECAGMSLMILSDHGHEPIRESIDLLALMAALDLPNDSYNYFIEVSSARFWFHTDGARRAVTSLLSKLDHGTCLSFDEMERYGIPLRDASYGEEFVFLDPGYIFFPHDFHHGLANLWLGLMDPMQRSRLRNPRHRGNHGHLSNFDVENSFVALLDRRYETRNTKGHILDLAPSVLAILGYDPPPTMNGHPIFRFKSRA